METTLDSVLHDLRASSQTTVEKGQSFEELAKRYFEVDAQQQQTLGKVWHYADWAQEQGIDRNDIGIDLVAELRNEDGFCAIQAKFYAEDTQLTESITSSFFAVADSSKFNRRILVDTTLPKVSSWVQTQLDEPSPIGQRVGLETLRNSSIDWTTIFDEETKSRPAKQPRTHQEEALVAVREGFQKNDRGQLIMACGTGKTYTGLIVAEDIVGRGGRVLVLVPSLALMAQTVSEWTNDATVPLSSYAVCSDSQVGRYGKQRVNTSNEDEIQVMPSDLVLPATTNPELLATHANQANVQTMSVIFATYQSLKVIETAQKSHNVREFDLIICDEAHRTTGQIKSDKEASNFVIVHDQNRIRGKRRLYMTATPRIYGENVKRRVAEMGAVELASMADEERYGPMFFHRGFAWAIENDLLTDYRVIVLAVSEGEVSEAVQNQLKDSNNELNLDVTTKIVGCYKALMKHSKDTETFSEDSQPCQSALAFCSTIKRSKLVQEMFNKVIEEYRENVVDESFDTSVGCTVEHVDGGTAGKVRSNHLNWLAESNQEAEECRVLSNVRCLSEGVDVPALDAILFVDARKSHIDVVQAVGRVMRKAPEKKLGYVVLPIGIPAGMSPEQALQDNERYHVVWQTLNALRSHDERIEGLIAAMQLGEDCGDRLQVIYEGLSSASKVTTISSNKVGPDNPFDDTKDVPEEIEVSTDLEPSLFDSLVQGLYAKLVEKCGVLNTWTDWAIDIAEIARHHIARLTVIVDKAENKDLFAAFLAELRDDLNDTITKEDAIEFLAQHMVTKPVFDAIFQGDQFTSSNSVSQAMQKVIDALDDENLEKEQVQLEGFYSSVRNRAAQVRTSHGKQELIRTLYEKFFQGAFGKMSERLGIVYTPVEVVDFILHSVDEILKECFNERIGSPGVSVLDPFTGTGSFITRLLDEDSGLIFDEDITPKYRNNLHANEIVPLAYYIAGVNIEAVYHGRLQRTSSSVIHEPFDGLCLADTFQSTEKEGGLLGNLLPRNHERLERQSTVPIEVIVGNPPYSAGQKSGDDNAQNVRYEHSDVRIQETYVKCNMGSTLLNSLYDSYIRAFRWASDRINENGVVAFVTNAGWLDSVAGSGVRACFVQEFSRIYVLNLRGNARTQGELRRQEGGNIFEVGSRAPIAITLLVKDPSHTRSGKILYHDIGDYLNREEKLQRLTSFKSINHVPWKDLRSDSYQDWLNHRDTNFASFIPVGDKRKTGATPALFEIYSHGIATSRDAWVYNFNANRLQAYVQKTMDFFNSELARKHTESINNDLVDWVQYDQRSIHWGDDFFNDLKKDREKKTSIESMRSVMYRPFCKTIGWISHDICSRLGQIPQIFPSSTSGNRLICVEDKGSKKEFSCIMTDVVPDLHLLGSAQCLPIRYSPKSISKTDDSNSNVLESHLTNTHRAEGKSKSSNLQHSAVSDSAVRYVSHHLPSANITKESLFYYTYGILHSPQYRERFQSNLSKELPRIPVVSSVDDFKRFAAIGLELGDLHVGYESAALPEDVLVNGEPASIESIDKVDQDELKVVKMSWKKNKKDTIVFNSSITISNIPLSAYDYIVNGKSAIEWIVDRYQTKVDKKTGIKNDPNDYAIETANDPAYILKLLLRVVSVSLKTNELVAQLPELKIAKDFVPHGEFFQQTSE